MKGIAFFKDGHVEEIFDYTKDDNIVYFKTVTGRYTRVRIPGGYFGDFFNKITAGNHIIPTMDIKRIDIFD